jgi:hypothetical protein
VGILDCIVPLDITLCRRIAVTRLWQPQFLFLSDEIKKICGEKETLSVIFVWVPYGNRTRVAVVKSKVLTGQVIGPLMDAR